jgi:hypothetical protein
MSRATERRSSAAGPALRSGRHRTVPHGGHAPYDWTAVPAFLREHITVPPFPVDHLTSSLRHLAELVQQATANGISARGHRAHWDSPPAGASFDVVTSA